ncbi:hypothetical protein ACFU8I_02945 [Streptomyces sp. NPDC057540]|uniref:hypothetical protein n=1 Tax=Streptomyces sp. NPDC057540 TaxID=3346160 RepID=UPI0036AF7B66
MDTPTLHGLELSPGDHVGTDVEPRCCDQDMTPRPVSHKNTFTCANCLTVMTVDSQGLVFDIR